MFKNYFKIAFRNLLKSKVYTSINISGLAIGIASCLLIMLFVSSETSYDQFHEKSENIYRVNLKFNLGTNQFDVAEGSYPAGPALVREYPEIKNAVRIWDGSFHGGSAFVSYGDVQFKEEKFYWADSTFPEIFSMVALEGDIHKALSIPNSVVINAKMAEKYFKGKNPIGEIIKIQNDKFFEVRAIAKDFPDNSHFHFDFLASLVSEQNRPQWGWIGIDVHTYVLLDELANWRELNSKLKDFSRAHMGPVVLQEMGLGWDDFLAAGNELGFFLQPLESIHLTQNIQNEFEPKGNINTIYIFTAIAFVILLIACVNFINLATARSGQRATEIGIRKVVGSRKGQLIGQFLVESILLSYISLLLAFLIVEITLPLFNGIIGNNLSTGMFPPVYYVFGFVFGGIFIGTIAGLYPAFALSSFNIISVLKGKIKTSQGKQFRNALVIFQFAISIILFVGTMVIYQQLNFVRAKDLGFDKERVMVISAAENLGSSQTAFKEQLLQFPSISHVTYSGSLPQMNLEARVFSKPEDSKKTYTLVTFSTDHDFMDTYKLRLREGRYFSRDLAGDTAAIILNQAALAALDIADINEARLFSVDGRQMMKVIGVFEDFHTESLHSPIRPAASVLMPQNGVERRLSIRITPGDIRETVRKIENKWKEFLPEHPLEYTFMDDQFADLYAADMQSGKVFTTFAILAVFIAGLGMLGLTSFITTQRTKEIGIRKVLGAAIPGILYMLFKDLLRWVAIANVFAWPLAWYGMSRWLENFAFRTEIAWWIFLAAGILAIAIAVITVSFQAFRAAIANPVNSLRYE